MSLRIAMIAYTHYESDPRVRREAEALAERGDYVAVYCLAAEGRPADAVEDGVRVLRIDLPRYRGGKAIAYAASYSRFLAVVSARLAAAHVEARFDVVHVHTMPDFMVLAGLVPRLSGAKVLLDMHDLMPELYALKFGLEKHGKAVSVLRGVQRAATALADAVICVHQNQYELLLRDGVPAWKLGIVMNAADPKLFPPREKEPRIEGEIRVVYHGTVLERYGVDLALEAFAKARTKEPRLLLSILGGGDFVDEVKALAGRLGLGPEVVKISGVHRPLDEVAQAIRTAHIGLVPNRDDQEDSVLPTKLLEYLSVGIPAVATRTRCVGRFFDGSQVELVGVGDVDGMAEAILRLAGDAKRRAAIVKAGHAWEAEYGWAVNKQHLYRAIDGLCEEKLEAERRAAKAAKAAAAEATEKADSKAGGEEKKATAPGPAKAKDPASPKEPAKANEKPGKKAAVS